MQVDLPDVLTEVTAQIARYENALVSNDVAALDEPFRDDCRTLRYGHQGIMAAHVSAIEELRGQKA